MPSVVVARETVAEFSESQSETVLLIGGFMGHWNFGDVLQLKSAIACHRDGRQDVLPIPLVNLETIRSPDDVELLKNVLGVGHVAFFHDADSPQKKARVDRLQLTSLLATPNQRVSLHVYGGGMLNRYWGAGYLALIESVVSTHVTGQYVMSGQQIDPVFADAVAVHCRAFQPDLVGCRDDGSVAMLRQRGVPAIFSGDDAVDEIASLASACPASRDVFGWRGRLGLHVSLASYVWTDGPEGEAGADDEAVNQLTLELRSLRDAFAATEPLILGALAERTLRLPDSLASLVLTGLTTHFPRIEFIDLVGSLVNGRLARDCVAVRACSLVVSSSYHVALLSKFLDIPTYLFAFNEYYRHKRETLADPHQSLAEFLAQGPEVALGRQRAYVKRLRARRQDWRDLFASWRARPAQRVPAPRSVAITAAAHGAITTTRHNHVAHVPLEQDAERVSRELEARIHELVAWIEQIEAGKAWLEEQRAAWQKAAENQCLVIDELRTIIARLQSTAEDAGSQTGS